MIIAVDFDGTLYAQNAVNLPLVARLRAAQQQGHTVILWTCREGESLREALSVLKDCGFTPNFANQNSPAVVRQLRRDPRKIFADVYIDDKSQRMEFSP